jgi:ribosome biogenesis GTPase / thiamine phosphate phosphatase
MDLKELGWCEFFEEAFRPHAQAGLVAGRVAVAHRGGYRIFSAGGAWTAEVTGKFRHEANGPSGLPAVGDWVAMQTLAGEGKAYIHGMLPRRTRISRVAAGDRPDEQVMAANIDVVFIVASLGDALNLRRIERYLVAARESGAEPILVLTKTDLCPDVDSRLKQTAAVVREVPVHAVSSVTGQGMTALSVCLRSARTGALFGPSGVGKSTLINHWCGEARLPVQPVRESDQKGRHTTTSRQLICLPSGGLIIDTPGMRELQLWEFGQARNDAFADVETLALQCRFTDCRHETEPDCAVRRALEGGHLDPARLESHRKLTREIRRTEQRNDPRVQAEERRRVTTLAKSVKPFKKRKR